MVNYLSKIGKPEVFHGEKKKTNFFEGWFFKLVDKNEKNILAVIPGIYISKDKSKEHAFIQILDGKSHTSHYLKFNKDEFRFIKNKFHVFIGDSFFSENKIELDIQNEDIKLKGKLEFSDLNKWPVTLISPGIMGWYSYVPFMECNHGIISLNHKIDGKLFYQNNEIDFTGGKGYGEKDWGSSFPSAYIWIQSNHFNNESVSLTASIAKIPWLFSSFRGYIIGLLIDGKLYKFTTYNGAILHCLKIDDDSALFEISDKKYYLKVSVKRTEGGVLHGPYQNEMTQRVSESLNAKVKVELTDKAAEKIIFKDEGRNSGLDINGKLEEIIDENY